MFSKNLLCNFIKRGGSKAVYKLKKTGKMVRGAFPIPNQGHLGMSDPRQVNLHPIGWRAERARELCWLVSFMCLIVHIGSLLQPPGPKRGFLGPKPFQRAPFLVDSCFDWNIGFGAQSIKHANVLSEKNHLSALGGPKVAMFGGDDLDPLYFEVHIFLDPPDPPYMSKNAKMCYL